MNNDAPDIIKNNDVVGGVLFLQAIILTATIQSMKKSSRKHLIVSLVGACKTA
jgi:uncharacterized membrane protein